MNLKNIVREELFSLTFLSFIDAIERLTRTLLVFTILHEVIKYSGYVDSKSGLFFVAEENNYILISLIGILYICASIVQYGVAAKRGSLLITCSIRIASLVKRIKNKNSPKYVTPNKVVILFSTLIQYVGLLVFALLMGYVGVVLVSLGIMLVYSLLVWGISQLSKFFENLPVSLSQTILLLLHMVVIAVTYYQLNGSIDVVLIFWFIAVRTALLYMGQLIHFSVYRL